MKKFSTKNMVKCSDGTKVSRAAAEVKIRAAKQRKLDAFFALHGYFFCEDCERNSNAGLPIDCSHDISIDKCFKSGRAELAWDENNITLRCRDCHREHDRSGING